MSALFGITGWKNSGKTTLVVRLVEEFTRRGFTVSTVKHAHSGFRVDHPGTDSHAHGEAGAQEVAILSDRNWALMHRAPQDDDPMALSAMLEKMSDCDLVLIEGFKTAAHPKIECRRNPGKEEAIWKTNDTIRALAARDMEPGCDLPQIQIDAVGEIADFIARQTGLSR